MGLNSRPPPRGRFANIGGRRLHWVEAGPPAAKPLVLLEAGSFGFSADWAVVQEKLAAKGIRSIAYDRAGMGLSDPGPALRDGVAIAEDLENLLAVIGETGPFILTGHSMAGLHIHLFAGRNPRQVAGLVLVDAITPTSAGHRAVKGYARHYGRLTRLAASVAETGLLKPLRRWGDRIALSPEASVHKRWAFAHGAHNRMAADEVQAWEATVRQALAVGPLDPDWPVAVVTAGPMRGFAWHKRLQNLPAQAARHGRAENIAEAGHANLLGYRYAKAVVDGVVFVCEALTKSE